MVLHYRQRNNNVGHRRGGEHERATLAPAGLYTRRGVGGEAVEQVVRTMSPMEEARRRERGGEQDLMGQIGEKGVVKG